MKRIAVLLTVYNRREKTLLCLKNLFAQEIPSGYAINVYLTNDGCTDGTPESVRQQFPQVHVIDVAGNLYWNRGMWTAWEIASKEYDYDYYLWLNDDTFLLPFSLGYLLKCSKRNTNKAIIIGATADTKTRSKITYGGWLMDDSLMIPNGLDQQAAYMNGNLVLVPKFVYDLVGNFDPYFTHSKGDFDYGKRARKLGILLILAPEILGLCDKHDHIDKWCDPSVPLLQRLKLMKKPNGMPANETFHLERRHEGVLNASFHYCTIYLRCIFPWIWSFRRK